ncbi:MAG: fibronectin type III domain-containing protein [Nitrospiraceae bacterium]|nr:fibronectin type III domain-containing protein [Nitrospiraceae bacterium]
MKYRGRFTSLFLVILGAALFPMPIPTQADTTIPHGHSLIVRPKPPATQEEQASPAQAGDRKDKSQPKLSLSTPPASTNKLTALPRTGKPIRLLSMGSRIPNTGAPPSQDREIKMMTDTSTETDTPSARGRGAARSIVRRGDEANQFSLPVAPSPPIVLVPMHMPASAPPAASSPSTQPPMPTTGAAILSWAATADGNPAGYRVYVGTTPGQYGYAGPFDVTGGTSFTLSDLPLGHTYYFAVSAFDQWGNESPKSDEVSKNIY